MKQGKLSRPAAIALILGGDLLLLVLGWVLLVSPQRQTAATIAKATQAAEAQIVEAQRAAHESETATVPKQPEIKTAGLYELAKAMPSSTDMPDLLLELDQVARASGVSVGSITPGPPVAVVGTPYSAVAIQLTFTGNFYSLTDLLYRLRSLVSVREGELDASGRLFAVNSVGLAPNGVGNGLTATVSVNAYVYGVPAGTTATTTPPAATPTSTATTSTGSTTTTTSTAPTSDVAPRP